jgi:outer membrane translocation and assembly module TamA
MRASLGATALLCLLAVSGCASIPKNRYGVRTLRFEGMDELDPRSLAACMATRERDRFAINVGRSYDPECGDPPFDGSRARLRMWSWGWTEWPVFDQALFDRDIERIERWYRARGYYDARVLSVGFDPPQAGTSDRMGPDMAKDGPACAAGDKGCPLAITVQLEEGEPVKVVKVEIAGAEGLPEKTARALRGAMLLEEGDRFDEAFYDRSKTALASVLRDASFACARVKGRVKLDPVTKEAAVRMEVEPGPPARFGSVRLEGAGDLPTKPVLGAALIRPGKPYSERALDDAQRAIYNLGAFSAVRVEPLISQETCPLPPEGEAPLAAAPASVDIPIVITVTPGRLVRFGVGAGLQSGTIRAGFDQTDVRQWDVHLLGVFEHRNLFGGLRRLRIEERPRLIFQDIFPRTTHPTPGNTLLVEFRQPAFLEPRTTLVASARWDLGPEPFGRRFNRHDLDARLALERAFLDGRVFLSGGIHENIFIVIDELYAAGGGTRDYHVMFFEQYANLDLRDDPRNPSRGAFFAMGLQEAGFLLPASWDYFRLTPEARGYIPLPLDMVVAFRVGMGVMFILDADQGLIESAQRLGPERYRLRGGGPSSNRGFVPGDLGDGIEGGLRRWEASLELRVPLSDSLGLVVFTDLGDVSRHELFRFNHLNMSVGGGLRYRTPVGPLRIDVGYRVPGAQVVGAPDPDPRFVVNLGFVKFPGAVHITIGEAF